MSEWVLLPWDFILMKKEDIERAEVFQDKNGFGIRIKNLVEYEDKTEEWRFKSKKTAQEMFLEFHKRLLEE